VADPLVPEPVGTTRGEDNLRHFYASLLISQGASVKVIQARLGHKGAVETLDTYGHLWPDDEDLTRQAVDGVLLGDPAAGDEISREQKEAE
jgi:integrase